MSETSIDPVVGTHQVKAQATEGGGAGRTIMFSVGGPGRTLGSRGPYKP